MADTPDSIPQTPDEMIEECPASPGSADSSSEASTPLDPPSSSSDAMPACPPVAPTDLPRRVPSLRTVSDPQNTTLMSSTSTVSGILNNARRPPPSANSLPSDLLQKARALQQQRMGRPPLSSQSSGSGPGGSRPISGVNSPVGGVPSAMAGNLRMPPQLGMGRPLPPGFPKSSPAVPSARKPPSLSERRAMKLGGLPGQGPTSGAGTPRLSDLNGSAGDAQRPSLNGNQQDNKLSDFKNYIDSEKGWITFEGAATITQTGVNFANGQTFSISLDEVEVLDELGKGNYGTVYKIRHSKAKIARIGQGLSGIKAPLRQNSSSEKDINASLDGIATGKVMAMKEIRLELDDAKFKTILKELVILHECVSPYIIDFYGAFFQEGAVYMCLEYMDGGSIDKLYTGGIPENVLRKITYSTIMGLKTLKDEHNIIHRDVKPTNILVNSNGQVKICDFGVSGNLVASIAKTNIGCQSYMAPERISGGGMAQHGANAEGTYSVQSDIWSLGLTIIECAMGRYPYPPEVSSTIFSQLSVRLPLRFRGHVTFETALTQYKAIVEGDPPDLPAEGYSAMAQDFVKSCLNKVPAKRHTYPMLLAHPWIQPLTKPETINEDEEVDDDAALADAAAKITLKTTGGDEEVATWVQDVLDKKQKGLLNVTKEQPALHAAPLDSVSPAASPAGSPLIA